MRPHELFLCSSLSIALRMNLVRLTSMMKDHGVTRLYAKVLAANDNSKNQPYFGGDFSVLNILPAAQPVATITGSYSKSIFKAALNFFWLDDNGTLHRAPNAKLILYPQYPEVRFSGYLQGATKAPSDLMGTTRIPGRLLFLGVTSDGRIVGYAAAHDSPIAAEFGTVRNLQQTGVFLQVPLPSVPDALSDRLAVLSQLCRIANLGWIDSKRLATDRTVKDCQAPNCGGYTLEAELGITPNGYSEPDYHGWEVKQHAVGDFTRYRGGPVTLMTPEPTGGVYREEGVLSFVETFGYEDRAGRADRLNFGGLHRCGRLCSATGLTLKLVGYDATTGKITDASGGITLVDANERQAATWYYSDLMKHWNRKHATAVYVPSMKQESPRRQYRYAHRVRLGVGTDFLRFLSAVSSGHVYYDPGIKIENYPTAPRSKRRSQFRIKESDLDRLYAEMETVEACDQNGKGG